MRQTILALALVLAPAVARADAPRTFVYDHPSKPDVVRASVEQVGLLALGFGDYLLELPSNSEDWDLPVSGESVARKLSFRAWSFDTNRFFTNFVTHLSGGLYYSVARSNRISIGGSLGYAIGASLFWEIVGEVRENASINDAIYTPVAGLALGEPLVQLGAFFDAAEPHGWTKALGSIFGPFKSVHDAMDGLYPKRTTSPDRWGFDSDWAHVLEIHAGGGVTFQNGSTYADVDARASARLVHLRGYDSPGTGVTYFSDGNVSSIALEATAYQGGIADAAVRSSVLFGGVHDRTHGLLAGAGMGFDLETHDWDRAHRSRNDDTAIVDVLLLSIEPTTFGNGFVLRTGIDASFDFAGVTTFALDAWNERRASDRLPTVVQRRGYGYVLGASLSPRIEIALPRVRMGARLRASSFVGIPGLDRFDVPADIPIRDERMTCEAWLAWRIHAPFEISIHARERLRAGAISDVRTDRSEATIGASFGLVF